MPRVQSIFSYTLPAVAPYVTVPPAAPLNCGCNDLILILKNRSLVQTALQGILRVEIKSVAVSATPVQPVDGSVNKVWKYDYTVEYDTASLTDANYRVRRCDIEYNCCYSCPMAFVDRQLLGYVKHIGGDGVDNTDPQNPVITSDALVNNGNRSFTHTAVDGTETIFCQGLQGIDSDDDNTGGVGEGYMITQADLGLTLGDGCTFYLNSAPEHTNISGQVGGTLTLPVLMTPGDGSVVTGPVVGQNTVTITNNTKRQMIVFVGLAAAFDFGLRGPTSEVQYKQELSIDGGAFNPQTSDRKAITGMPGGSLFSFTDTVSVPTNAIWSLAPGAHVDLAHRLRVEVISGTVDVSTQSARLFWFGQTV